MTKRKRSPPSSTPVPDRVPFEVPESLYRLQAITRELARQSEVLVAQNGLSQDQHLHDLQHASTEGPRFDAQLFQTNALRFSPYSSKPILPSQPWLETANQTHPQLHIENQPEQQDAAVLPIESDDQAPAEDDLQRPISADPTGQLFDELRSALGPPPGPNETQYYIGGQLMEFDDPQPPSWSPPIQYQSNMSAYPPLDNMAPTQYATTLAHHPTHVNNNHLGGPSTAPAFYNPKLHQQHHQTHAHPHSNQGPFSSKPSMPGYYKSNLRTWPHNEAHDPSSRGINPLAPYAQDPYAPLPSFAATSSYPPPPQPLASSPVSAFPEYGNKRR